MAITARAGGEKGRAGLPSWHVLNSADCGLGRLRRDVYVEDRVRNVALLVFGHDFDLVLAGGNEDLDVDRTGEREVHGQLESKGSYAVVISDMRMPGMDGIELLKRVKKASPDTVRIMLTGNADVETAIEAINEGSIFRFLIKPCNKATMAKAISGRPFELGGTGAV